MSLAELRNKIYAKMDELPTLPVVVSKLLGLLDDPKSEVTALGEVIAQDPALAAKVLKVANSAYYGFSQEIASLDRAVALLGLNMVKSLALSIGVINNLPRGQDSPLLSHRGLWLHSVATATMIKELQARTQPKVDEDYLFVVGLLHDVGKMVLLHFFYDKYQEALAQVAGQEDLKLHAAETRYLGVDHAEVGSMLLTRWKFPPQVIEPITAHHLHGEEPKTVSRDLALLRVANALPQEAGIGSDGNPRPPQVLAAELAALAMTADDLAAMRAYTEAAREKIATFFDAVS